MIMRGNRGNLFGKTSKRKNIFAGAVSYDNWFKKTVIRTVISAVLLIMILLVQALNFEPPKKMLSFIETRLESHFDIKAFLAKAKKMPGYISTFRDKAVAVMKMEHGPNKRLEIPIDGKITTYFGEEIDGTSNISRGLIFAGDIGRDIYSVDAGVVIDVGSNKSIGNYVIIKHKGELLSVYKYVGTNNTNINQRVERGQAIGTSSDKLLLEIWYRNKPINPIKHMDINI